MTSMTHPAICFSVGGETAGDNDGGWVQYERAGGFVSSSSAAPLPNRKLQRGNRADGQHCPSTLCRPQHRRRHGERSFVTTVWCLGLPYVKWNLLELILPSYRSVLSYTTTLTHWLTYIKRLRTSWYWTSMIPTYYVVSLGFKVPDLPWPNRIHCTGPRNGTDGKRGKDSVGIGQTGAHRFSNWEKNLPGSHFGKNLHPQSSYAILNVCHSDNILS